MVTFDDIAAVMFKYDDVSIIPCMYYLLVFSMYISELIEYYLTETWFSFNDFHKINYQVNGNEINLKIKFRWCNIFCIVFFSIAAVFY